MDIWTAKTSDPLHMFRFERPLLVRYTDSELPEITIEILGEGGLEIKDSWLLKPLFELNIVNLYPLPTMYKELWSFMKEYKITDLLLVSNSDRLLNKEKEKFLCSRS